MSWETYDVVLLRRSTGQLLIMPACDEAAEMAKKPISVLPVPGASDAFQDEEGYPATGSATVDFVTGMEPTLHDFPGGYLYDFNPDIDKISVAIRSFKDGGTPKVTFKGVLRSWDSSRGDKAGRLLCDGGLAAYQNDDLDASEPPLGDNGEPIYGQSVLEMLAAIAYQMPDLVKVVLEAPNLTTEGLLPYLSIAESAPRFWSFYQHPEVRWCKNAPGGLPDQRGMKVLALATDNNAINPAIYMAVDDRLMVFYPLADEFYYLAQIGVQGEPLLAGEVWQVKGMHYNAAPKLVMQMAKHKTYDFGQSPADQNFRAFEVEYPL